MKALAEISPLLRDGGCQIVAVSPGNAPNAARMIEDAGADCPMPCDRGLGVATMLGLSYAIDDDLRCELGALDVDLKEGGEGWLLPIAATFVIAPDGGIVAQHLSPDPRIRMEG